MPLVSIILPTCDRPTLLPRAVSSVLAQTERAFELLLIDNNRNTPPVSVTDNAQAWARDPRVQVIRPEIMRNAAMARNAGLALARGEWVSYLDDDDAWRPQKLARQIALACTAEAPVVLCGAAFHLRGRTRVVQCGAHTWCGDDMLLRARWNTPLLLHRHPGPARFDESLSPGEDAEFAHRLLAAANVSAVPIVPEPLVDIYPQPGSRVNTNPGPVLPAAARILALRRGFYSRGARRRFVLQAMLAVAKLRRRPLTCANIGLRLLGESHGADWRAVANALAVSLRIAPGRWVS